MCKLSFTFALFLKVSKSKSWESISKSWDKEWKGDKKVHLHSKDHASFSEISSIGQLFLASVQCGRLDLMDIPKPMIKCCRWCCRTNIVVLIWVSVGLLSHKCLRLVRLGLYAISTLRVNHVAAIVAHVCYISLLRCSYYHKYLACEEEDFCERYILLEGDWELLSGERLVILQSIHSLNNFGDWSHRG